MKLIPAGDCALTAEYGSSIDPEINHKVHALYLLVNQAAIDGVISAVPTYRSLLVNYDPFKITYAALCQRLEAINENLDHVKLPEKTVVEIPVLYGGEAGPDLDFVARHNNLTREEVIKIHLSRKYLIYMLGFSPGFPYLGGMDERISAPRLKSPRTRIRAGSVGIAGSQTGIYSVDSPGGWQLIGHTPLKLYNPASENPFIYSQGDYIRFTAVNKQEYEKILKDVERGTFTIRKYPLKGGQS